MQRRVIFSGLSGLGNPVRGRLFGQRHLYLVDASAFDRVGRETEVVRGHGIALFQKNRA